jgi:hypothetical protein
MRWWVRPSRVQAGIGGWWGGRTRGEFQFIEGGRCHVEQIHGLGNVDERVCVIFQTKLFALVVEVCFDEKVGAKSRRPREGRIVGPWR